VGKYLHTIVAWINNIYNKVKEKLQIVNIKMKIGLMGEIGAITEAHLHLK